MRGFRPTELLQGTSRYVVNYETNVFTPVSLLGFRLAGIAFVDAAWITDSPRQAQLMRETPYTGFGLGLRFRNEFIAVPTIQLLLGYYPRGQLTNNGLRIFQSNSLYYGFSDFSFGQPGVSQFQ